MIIILLALFSGGAIAKDVTASEVAAIDHKVQCTSYRAGWITDVTGPCSRFVPPAKISVGQQFSVGGTKRTIKFIIATQIEKDIQSYGLNLKKGDWYCVAGETLADVKPEGSATQRTWLYIPHCRPVR